MEYCSDLAHLVSGDVEATDRVAGRPLCSRHAASLRAALVEPEDEEEQEG